MKKITLILFLFFTLVSCNLFDQKPDYIIKENSEYYWKVKFNPISTDSVIRKYHKPVDFITTITNKAGKQRVYYHNYNGHVVVIRHCRWYYDVNVGSKIMLRHDFENNFDEFIKVIK